ncbi:TPMT family class I SAM-dependent methyltransferase [Hymenobacter latericus]|uniref:TPMT family class I SAM-dependent methyltransferase n=1 Tax=Hymenobacter sp. YIM 151858-1 TaxID=2987688 RepID=UPI0022261948|nr:TPMT family class I SAM-dependent methyltransferase [Hymenobacter sp. YIM 151858-1]UYZ59323.1 TPMT family class I SAM-dependent methyltransferase [Hymenobacter sp. YIM 151858-1]
MSATPFDAAYWSARYAAGHDQWDTGAVTEPLRAYFAQLGPGDARRILIPGAGRAYEAEYLHRAGFAQVYVADIAPEALGALQQRVPDFPAEHLLLQDFFALQGPYDLIVEQTFFCALDPALRLRYAQQCANLLRPGGKLVGLLFDGQVGPGNEPPFGGTRQEYRRYFEPYFDFIYFDTAYNSIKPRADRELFICLQKKADTLA